MISGSRTAFPTGPLPYCGFYNSGEIVKPKVLTSILDQACLTVDELMRLL